MILHIRPDLPAADLATLADRIGGTPVQHRDGPRIVLSSSVMEVPDLARNATEASFTFPTDIQFASAGYGPRRTVHLGERAIGGDGNATLVITGPCSVESEDQIMAMAGFCADQGVGVLRAGCFKPRTSPYSFQGLGEEGLRLLRAAGDAHGLRIITEVRDATHVDAVIETTDIIQIGAKAMYDHGILRACGAARKPVLLKRGFGSTLQEFVQAAEFVLSGGNEDVILCERGIRTFETKTRFTLDLCGVAWLKEHTNLPVVVDPSHAIGYRYGVADLSRAAVAMGVDGLIIESHPDPSVARSDAAQQLDREAFAELLASLRPVANAVGRRII